MAPPGSLGWPAGEAGTAAPAAQPPLPQQEDKQAVYVEALLRPGSSAPVQQVKQAVEAMLARKTLW